MKKSLSFIPNSITILRSVLTVWFILIVAGPRNFATPSAVLCILFVGICLSDLLDGAVARGLKAESALGGILDVSADGLFIFSSLLLFDFFAVLPVWFTMLVFADFLVFLTTSRFLIYMKYKSIRHILIFDMPGRIAAVLFYLIPMAAWVAFSRPTSQSQLVLNALLYLSTFLSGVSISERLFLCFTTLRKRTVIDGKSEIK